MGDRRVIHMEVVGWCRRRDACEEEGFDVIMVLTGRHDLSDGQEKKDEDLEEMHL